MKAADPIDTARLSSALTDLRLPAIKLVWPDFAARSDKEGWPAARFLAALAEHETAERARRRIERHLDEARLPPGKTFDSFEFDAVPMISKAQVMALAAATAGWRKARTCSCSACLAPANRISGRARPGAGGERLARAVHAHDRPRPAAPDRRRDLQLEAAIARLDKITSSSSMTSPTSARTRRRPAFCSSSSRPATNAAPADHRRTSPSATGRRSSRTKP